MQTQLSKNHELVQSDDGSFTAYSKEYDEHYHSTRDGALKESLLKHVKPAYALKKQQGDISILDICFGLGMNTLATLHYYEQNGFTGKLHIYSPELDNELLDSLMQFSYPQKFHKYLGIIEVLVQEGVYEDERLYIELFRGDAREYVKKFENFFDVVYQDAFSPSSNPVLWTQEYFADIARAIKNDGVLSTYSIALKTRLALHVNGFLLYLNKGKGFRDATLASKMPLHDYIAVDMEHKISCNPDVAPLRD